MRPKLVAIDLDGTLIGPDLEIAAADRRAVERAAAAGAAICLATGRLYSAAAPFAHALGAAAPMIVLNGAAIYQPTTGALLDCTPLTPAVALRAYDQLLAAGFHLQLYFDDRLYLERINERAKLYLDLSRIEPVVVNDLRGLLTVRATAGASPAATTIKKSELEPGPMKVLGVADEALVAATIPKLARELGNSASVFRSQRMFLEVTDPRISKGTALRWIARRLGISSGEVIAVGDSDNDVPMFATAGQSFAVANATPDARRAASRIVAPLGKGGVAEALEIAFDGFRNGGT